MFYQLKNPSKRILDAMLEDSSGGSDRKCPDCAVAAKEAHEDGCDVARCLNTGAQRLGCDCGVCGLDVWDGLWPGTMTAYEKGWVVYDGASGSLIFDYNRVAVFDQTGRDGGFVA